jgi:hypothetical protein
MTKQSSGLSSPKSEFKSLVGLSKPLLERLLTDWVNMKIPSVESSKQEKKEFADAYARLRLRYGSLADPVSMNIIHSFLRAAWDAKTLREKEWLLYRLRDVHAKMERRRATPELAHIDLFAAEMNAAYLANAVPPQTPVEDMAYYLLRNARRARKCVSPECPAPYFFSTKRRQQYCGDDCTRVAKLRVKRESWHRAKLKRKSKLKER